VPEHLSDNKHQVPNTTWAFDLDPVHSWAYLEKAFTEEECKQIIEIGNSVGLEKGATRGPMPESRESEISWLYPNSELDWVYRRMTDIVTSLNDRFFKFDLFGATEGLQFTKYVAPSGKYGRHVDSAFGAAVRKLSFTLQLSAPSDYEGGNLNLYLSEKPEIMDKSQGFVVVFPSYVLHEVTPVTKGTRYSLVSWITGKPFR